MAMNYPYSTASTSQDAYTTPIRSELKKKGISDERITYNPNQGVLVDNKAFIRPERNYAGSTFTSPTNFQNAWDAYSKSLNQPQAGVGTAAGTMVGATGMPTQTGPTAGFTQQAGPTGGQVNPLNEQINKIIQGLQNYGQNQPAFDPYSSAAYQAAQAQTARQTQQGIRQAQEAFGSAGFGRSTGLGERAQRIGQEGTQYLMTQVLPQIQAQEQARRQQEYQNTIAALTPLLGQQSREDLLRQQNIVNTGNIPISPESQGIINQLIGLKNQAETAGAGGATAETMGQFRSQGDVLRNQLKNLGIDISGLGAETSAADVNIPTQRSIAGQQLDINKQIEERNFNFQKSQQEWENNFKQGQFNWNKAQQDWENAFKEKDFQRSMEEAAASRGLQWASLDQRTKEFVADQAFREKQFEFQKEQAGAKGNTAEDYAKFTDGVANYMTDPSTGAKKLSNPTDVESSILQSGLPESEMHKLYTRYGLPWG